MTDTFKNIDFDQMSFDERVAWAKGYIALSIGEGKFGDAVSHVCERFNREAFHRGQALASKQQSEMTTTDERTRFLNLGELMDQSDQYDPDLPAWFDWDGQVAVESFVTSWRGNNEDLAIGYVLGADRTITMGHLHRMLVGAHGSTFEGWSGGMFVMHRKSRVVVENEGCYQSKRGITGFVFLNTHVVLITAEE